MKKSQARRRQSMLVKSTSSKNDGGALSSSSSIRNLNQQNNYQNVPYTQSFFKKRDNLESRDRFRNQIETDSDYKSSGSQNSSLS